QLRYLNIKHSIANGDLEEIIDIPKESINQYGGFKLSKIDVSNSIHGGNHTAGMIQYAYSLYRINGSETPISPLSELVSLDKITAGGGEVNEIVGKSPIIRISNIDSNYTNIKIYAIKYTSLNETPSVSIIEDAEIPSNGTLQIIDTGDIIQTISLEEFLFLGNDSIIAKNIVAKDNRLFYSNYKEKLYDLDVDVRCYSFDSSGSAIIYSNLIVINEDTVTGTPLSVDS